MFVVFLAVFSVVGWALAGWASASADPGDESFAAAYVRESAQMFGVMSVLAIVAGLPVALTVEQNVGLAVPLGIGTVMVGVGLVVVNLLGRRFPQTGLPTADHWRDQLGDELARPGVPLAFGFVVIAAIGIAILAS